MSSPLLLLVHGRAGGAVPSEISGLAAELGRHRRSPVRILTLTAPAPPEPDAVQRARTLVPLFLLPGSHVRFDVPALAAAWRRQGPLRRVPFLGAWPAWQRALAEEAAALLPERSGGDGTRPQLLHHPIEGRLADRYLRHLEHHCRVRCRPAPYSASDPEAIPLPSDGPLLPLALAANRLTDSLGHRLGPPLLARSRCRTVLVSLLASLP